MRSLQVKATSHVDLQRPRSELSVADGTLSKVRRSSHQSLAHHRRASNVETFLRRMISVSTFFTALKKVD